MANQDAKKVVLPHSKAKLDLFRSYLERYFAILGLAKWTTKINIYDIFCGIGLYEDGNVGSPLIAVECVENNNALFEKNNWQKKPMTLNINDGSKDKIENVRGLLQNKLIPNCTIKFYNHDADEMLDLVIKEINSFNKSEINLVFIDPYGYSNISKEKITALLQNKRSEILLFLPVMQMYRFSDVVFTDFEKKCYDDLRRFISEFMSIDERHDSVFSFINSIKNGFSFNNEYYTCSHYIERDKGNYYAVFFITSNIYGLEKMLEVKWKSDPAQGKGYKKQAKQTDLFGDHLVEYDKSNEIEFLKEKILSRLKEGLLLSNVDLYLLTLEAGFLPKHTNQVIKDLKNIKRIITCNGAGEYFDFGSATYIDYEHYKIKNQIVYIKLR